MSSGGISRTSVVSLFVFYFFEDINLYISYILVPDDTLVIKKKQKLNQSALKLNDVDDLI